MGQFLSIVSILLISTMVFAEDSLTGANSNPDKPWISHPKPVRNTGGLAFGQIIDDLVPGPCGQPGGCGSGIGGFFNFDGGDEIEPFWPYFVDATGEFGGGKGDKPQQPQGTRVWPQTYPGGPEIPVPPETRRQAQDDSLFNTGGLALSLPPEFHDRTGQLWKALANPDKQQMLWGTVAVLAAGTAYTLASQARMQKVAKVALRALLPVGVVISMQQAVNAAEQGSDLELMVADVDDFYANYEHAQDMIAIQGPEALAFYVELSEQLQAAAQQ